MIAPDMTGEPTLKLAKSATVTPPRVVSVAECRGFLEFCGLSPTVTERCSALFMFELYCGARLPNLPWDPAKIVAEVRSLEGVGRPVGTKPAEQFERPPLQELWKKHYLVGGMHSMAENIRLGLGRRQRKLREIIEEKYNPATAHLSSETIAKNVADAITSTYIERWRGQCLTGEWIVYARHEGQNHYLCLATHNEDEVEILERIKRGCVDEFPFLRSQLKFD